MGNDDPMPEETKHHTTKMALNLTYPALVALIGGDTEAEIHIRSQIMDRFAEAYLKPLINTVAMRDTVDTLTKGFNQIVTQQVNSYLGDAVSSRFSAPVQFRPDIKNKIVELCNTTFNQIVNEAIAKAQQDFDAKWEDTIDSYIEKRMSVYVEGIVKEKVNARLAKLAKEMV